MNEIVDKILGLSGLYRNGVIRFVVYIVSALIIYRIFKYIIVLLKKNKLRKKIFTSKKLDVLFSVFTGVVKYVFSFIVVLLILRDVFKVNPALIVTATGVLGLAVGLGIQGLLKDFISGFFLLFENQFDIGDYISINNVKGQVIEFSIKNVKIRDYNGYAHVIPNGSISIIKKHTGKYDKLIISIYYPRDNRDAVNIVKNIKNNINERFGEFIKGLGDNMINSSGNSKKDGAGIGKFDYIYFEIKTIPFCDKVINDIRELIQKSIPDSLIYVDEKK